LILVVVPAVVVPKVPDATAKDLTGDAEEVMIRAGARGH